MKRSILLGLFVCVTALFSEEATKYTVVKGDNLWDLASKYLGSGFQWKKIWDDNQQVKNPDLIYPGDVILIQGGTISVLRTNGEQYTVGTTNFVDTTLGYKNDLRGITGAKSFRDSLLKDDLSDMAKDYLSQYRAIAQRETPIVFGPEDSVAVPVGRIADKSRYYFLPYQKVRVVFDSTISPKTGEFYEIFRHGKKFDSKEKENPYVVYIPVATAIVLGSRDDTTIVELREVYGKVADDCPVVAARAPVDVSSLDITANTTPLSGMDVVSKVSTGETIIPYSYVIVNKGSSQGVKMGDIVQGYAIEKTGGADYAPALLGVVSYVSKSAATVRIFKVLAQTYYKSYTFTRIGHIAVK